LLQNPDDLLLAESALPHDDGLLGRRHELLTGIPGGGKVKRTNITDCCFHWFKMSR